MNLIDLVSKKFGIDGSEYQDILRKIKSIPLKVETTEKSIEKAKVLSKILSEIDENTLMLQDEK